MNESLEIITTNQFSRDVKRIRKQGLEEKKLTQVVRLIQDKKNLPKRCRDHRLKGNWKYHRECHIEPDWLLIYRTTNEFLFLERTGSHSDLF